MKHFSRCKVVKVFWSRKNRNLDKLFGGGIIERNTFMSDITKCPGWDCPLREKCFRYLAQSGPYQSFFTEKHYDKEKGNCQFFWATVGR